MLSTMNLSWPSEIPPWMSSQWGLFLGLIFCAFLSFFVIRSYFISLIVQFFKGRKLIYNKKYQNKIMIPFGLTAFFLVIYYGHGWILISEKGSQWVNRLSQIGLTIGAVWMSLTLVNIVSLYFEERAKTTPQKFDDILIPLLRSFAKLVVISMGTVFVGHSLTIDVKSIIAGLGIGGIALALAAKDTLSNFFGSLAVILDRPFEIGDWVVFGNGVEGTVLNVGFRSTRIKTFYDSEIVVPNNQLTNMHVDNYGRRKYRRFSTKISVQYDTPPEKIEAFCEGIRKLILERPRTRKDYFHVYLNEMDASSLNILLYVFWQVKDWSQELAERHWLLIDITRLAKTMEVEFAFPTQTLHVFNENKNELKAIDDNFYEAGQKLAQDITRKRISPLTSRSSKDEALKPPLE